MSFSRYLTLVRMDRAKFMLKRFTMTLSCPATAPRRVCRIDRIRESSDIPRLPHRHRYPAWRTGCDGWHGDPIG